MKQEQLCTNAPHFRQQSRASFQIPSSLQRHAHSTIGNHQHSSTTHPFTKVTTTNLSYNSVWFIPRLRRGKTGQRQVPRCNTYIGFSRYDCILG